MLLLILAAIWAAVLLPPWLQNRRERRPNDSIVSFQTQLATLQRATPGGARIHQFPTMHTAASVMAARTRLTRSEAKRRRRDVLTTLAGAAAVTLLLSLFLGGAVLALHLFVDVLLVGYVVLLVHTQQQYLERSRKVRYLPTEVDAPEPALLLRRSGS